MLKITDELIEKYLKGLCTKEESRAVWKYFHNNPDEKYLLDEFQRADSSSPLPPGYREEMLAFIEAEIGEGWRSAEQESNATEMPAGELMVVRDRGMPFRRWIAAAAAVMILAVVSLYLLRPGGNGSGDQHARPQLAVISWIDQYNSEKKIRSMILPDSSKVRLLPGAHIRYRKDFGNYDKREIEVVGKAWFEVAKNEKMPFVVYCEGINTTALGTSFDVSATPNTEQIKIKLYEGKVLVSLDTLASGNERKDYYLSPGQELVFDRKSRNVAIREPVRTRSAEPIITRHNTLRIDSLSNWYMFNNQTLADVFDQLSAIYNVNIQYSRKDIRKMYFIGKIEKKDSLHKIIQDIALLNHLTVTNHDGSYIITKN